MSTPGTLKPGWRTVKFGDVVRQVKDKVDPEVAGIERYVAGQHMNTDDLRIRRWGAVGDGYLGPAFTMRFMPGQVLYGSRRTYLRKVAVADFEGICANTTFVIESVSDELLPEFLPYVMTAESFHEHSIKQSKGSVNPYINFTDLKWYEFALPPLDEQLRVVELLDAAMADNARKRKSSGAFSMALVAMLAEIDQRSFELLTLEALCRHPITYGIVQAGPDVSDGIPYIRVSDMTAYETLRCDKLPRTSPEVAAKYERSACDEGDLVFALRGPIGLTREVPPELAGVNLTQGTARLSPDTTLVTSAYLGWALQFPSVAKQFRRSKKGSTFQEVSLGSLRRITAPVPPLEVQSELLKRLRKIDDLRRICDDAAENSSALEAQLRERCLDGRSDA